LGVFAQTQDDFSAHMLIGRRGMIPTPSLRTNKHYVDSNLVPEKLALANINLVLYIHSSGQLSLHRFDLKSKKKTFVPEVTQTPFCQ